MSRTAPLILALLLAPLARAQQDPMHQASRLRDQRKYAEAIDLLLPIARSEKEKPERRFEAFRAAGGCYENIGAPRKAIALYEEGMDALGREGRFLGPLLAQAADVYRQRLAVPDAALYLERALVGLDLDALPPEDAAHVLGRLAQLRGQLGQLQAARHVAGQAVDYARRAGKPTALLVAAATEAGLLIQLGQYDAARELLDGLEDTGKDYYAAQHAARAYEELGKRLVEAGRRDEAREVALRMLRLFGPREASRARDAIRLLFRAAPAAEALDALAAQEDDVVAGIASQYVLPELVPAALAAQKGDPLVRLCVRAMLARLLDEDDARVCLRAIARVRAHQGRLDDALAAARAYYGITGFEDAGNDEFNQAVSLVSDMLRARDGHLVGANAFVQYQTFGTAGRDRKTGTDDDVEPPLKGVTFRAEPAVDPLFQKALEAQPISYEGRRRRGWVYLLWCKPEQALGEFKRAFALCPLDNDELERAAQEVALALKALNGTPVGMDAFAQFQRHGPAGPDGRDGTADDLTNPLADY